MRNLMATPGSGGDPDGGASEKSWSSDSFNEDLRRAGMDTGPEEEAGAADVREGGESGRSTSSSFAAVGLDASK